MSPIGLVESFQRLEDFPSFISCIKCFGKPIIPPLLTASRRNELHEIRTTAINKEAEILSRRKKRLSELEKKLCIPASLCEINCQTNFVSRDNKSCALWYPSINDCPESISVAISKFPTSGIYSSVHTNAIVCSNVIEDQKLNGDVPRQSLSSDLNSIDYDECSHSNNNIECGLCQAEYIQNLNSSFSTEKSPEVPCRTYSLIQSGVSTAYKEENDETECDSLSTVIYNQKNFVRDTDSESNATFMTQSTDLEKYMEFPCEYSPDNSSVMWDTKSTSQQLSRSDEASSETVVNTENELTPCASTLAEFTDNLEDELSFVEGNPNVSDCEMPSSRIKRAHSVDSYMKIIQACSGNFHVKKSHSEPLDGNLNLFSRFRNEKKTHSSKTAHFIKEDSKESDEGKDMPEKDNSVNNTNISNDENQSNCEHIPDSNTNEIKSPEKTHIRQSSYTLDEPSPVLIQAHADCSCNFDPDCISPHCSSISKKDETPQNSAFIKEKLSDIPVTSYQMKKFPVSGLEYSSVCSSEQKDDYTPVVDVFPTVNEGSCVKYDSENKPVSENHSTTAVSSGVENTENNKDHLKQVPSVASLEIDETQDYIVKMCQELRRNHEIKLQELIAEQNRQWLKLEEEFKEQERLLCEKLKISVLTPPGSNENENQNQIIVNKNVIDESNNCCKDIKLHCEENRKMNESSSTILSSEMVPETDNISKCTVNISEQNSQEFNSPENYRASSFPSCDSRMSSNCSLISSKAQDHVNNSHLINQSSSDNYSSASQFSESLSDTSVFRKQTKINLKPMNIIDVPPHLMQDSIYFCHDSNKNCEYCTSSNAYNKYNSSSFEFDCVTVPKEQTASNNAEVTKMSHNISSVTPQKSVITMSKSCENIKCHQEIKHDIHTKFDISTKSRTSSISHPDVMKFSNSIGENGESTVKELKKFPLSSILSSLCGNNIKAGSFPKNKQDIDPVLLKKFEKLPAFVKGYLTRRLFKTERVQNLIKTLQDTILLLEKFNEEPSKKEISEKDVNFHRQLIAEFMKTFDSIYDIFCTISTKERMKIIADSRKLKIKQKMKELGNDSLPPVTTKASSSSASKKQKLSSATLKALERKRSSTIDSRTYTIEDFRSYRSRSSIDSRTYTIEDLKACKLRSRSNTSLKNHPYSASVIYKSSVGISPKKKSIGSKTSGTRRCLHLRWVP